MASALSFSVADANVPLLQAASGAGSGDADSKPLAGNDVFVQLQGGTSEAARRNNAEVRELMGRIGGTLLSNERHARYVVIVDPRDAGAASILSSAKRLYSTAQAKASAKRVSAMRWKDPKRQEDDLRKADRIEEEVCNRDFVLLEWLRACDRAGQVVPIRWEHVIVPSFQTRQELTRISDQFHDYYEEDATKESLELSLAEVGRQAQALARAGTRGSSGASAAKKRRIETSVGAGADVSLLALLHGSKREDGQPASREERFDVALRSILAQLAQDDLDGEGGSQDGASSFGDLGFLS